MRQQHPTARLHFEAQVRTSIHNAPTELHPHTGLRIAPIDPRRQLDVPAQPRDPTEVLPGSAFEQQPHLPDLGPHRRQQLRLLIRIKLHKEAVRPHRPVEPPPRRHLVAPPRRRHHHLDVSLDVGLRQGWITCPSGSPRPHRSPASPRSSDPAAATTARRDAHRRAPSPPPSRALRQNPAPRRCRSASHQATRLPEHQTPAPTDRRAPLRASQPPGPACPRSSSGCRDPTAPGRPLPNRPPLLHLRRPVKAGSGSGSAAPTTQPYPTGHRQGRHNAAAPRI